MVELETQNNNENSLLEGLNLPAGKFNFYSVDGDPEEKEFNKKYTSYEEWYKDKTSSGNIIFESDANDISELTPMFAKKLRELWENCEYRYLPLNGVDKLDPTVAKELSKFDGNILELNSLPTISKKIAEILSHFQGEYINLLGVNDIDYDTLEALAQYTGTIFLPPLTNFKNKSIKYKVLAIEESGKCKGHITFEGVDAKDAI